MSSLVIQSIPYDTVERRDRRKVSVKSMLLYSVLRENGLSVLYYYIQATGIKGYRRWLEVLGRGSSLHECRGSAINAY